ncbi:hypothetical protein DAD186_01330 [Dermabacter vaginalis]|uniref:Uncharacterized protein n=1 Tax=Dermabacter vaginalis TaxID=1630135 RepID=A0A1B0ZFH0_9MICO|nr:hypothetical protein [Dermabacter vaginalis]ANP26692.1 hypothetical protein DAD186_01330 [Dermabacter vaginalis]
MATNQAEKRVRFRDVKPFEVADSLEELRGPSEGLLTPPVDVHWSGLRTTFDVSNERQRRRLYQAVLSNGRQEHLTAFLNRDLLLHDWPTLTLDTRIVDSWARRFPEIEQRRRR